MPVTVTLQTVQPRTLAAVRRGSRPRRHRLSLAARPGSGLDFPPLSARAADRRPQHFPLPSCGPTVCPDYVRLRRRGDPSVRSRGRGARRRNAGWRGPRSSSIAAPMINSAWRMRRSISGWRTMAGPRPGIPGKSMATRRRTRPIPRPPSFTSSSNLQAGIRPALAVDQSRLDLPRRPQ